MRRVARAEGGGGGLGGERKGGTGAIRCAWEGRGNGKAEGAREGRGAQGGTLNGEDSHNLQLFGDKSLIDCVIFMEEAKPAAVLLAQEALLSFPVDSGIVD